MDVQSNLTAVWINVLYTWRKCEIVTSNEYDFVILSTCPLFVMCLVFMVLAIFVKLKL